jgi:hypothetical protein
LFAITTLEEIDAADNDEADAVSFICGKKRKEKLMKKFDRSSKHKIYTVGYLYLLFLRTTTMQKFCMKKPTTTSLCAKHLVVVSITIAYLKVTQPTL